MRYVTFDPLTHNCVTGLRWPERATWREGRAGSARPRWNTRPARPTRTPRRKRGKRYKLTQPSNFMLLYDPYLYSGKAFARFLGAHSNDLENLYFFAQWTLWIGFRVLARSLFIIAVTFYDRLESFVLFLYRMFWRYYFFGLSVKLTYWNKCLGNQTGVFYGVHLYKLKYSQKR